MMSTVKKYVFIILAAVVIAIVGLFYYSYRDNETSPSNEKQSSVDEAPPEKDIREIVWNQLSARQKEEVDGTWTDGEVSKTTLSENAVTNTSVDTSYVGKEAYLISFPSKLSPTLGDLLVYADVDTTVIIGYGLRD